jgi:gas vesicle protein
MLRFIIGGLVGAAVTAIAMSQDAENEKKETSSSSCEPETTDQPLDEMKGKTDNDFDGGVKTHFTQLTEELNRLMNMERR